MALDLDSIRHADVSLPKAPFLLKLAPAGFALFSVFSLAFCILAFLVQGGRLVFMGVDIPHSLYTLVLLPQLLFWSGSSAYLGWGFWKGKRGARIAAVVLPAIAGCLAMTTAGFLGQPLLGAFLSAGWKPFALAAGFGALFFGNGRVGQYLKSVAASPRAIQRDS